MGINHATWFITSKCNLACEYCFTRFNTNFPSEDSNLETGKAIIDLLIMNSTTPQVNLAFFGGEPLLQFPLMRDVVDYGRKRAAMAQKEITFSITTNGTLINEEVMEWLKNEQINPLLSMDGMPHPENKRVFKSGEPSAGIVLEKALTLLENGFQPTIRWTFAPCDIGNLDNDVKVLLRYGFNVLAIEPVYEVGWTAEDLARYEQALAEISRLYLHYMRMGRGIVIKPIDDALQLFAVDERQTMRCGTATGGVGVDMAGNIYPCHRFVTRREPIIGHVSTGFNAEALKAAQLFDIGKIRSASPSQSCLDCPVRVRCPGGCLCVNLDVCGDAYVAPDVYCKLQLINQRVANDIGFILHGEKNKLFADRLTAPAMRT